MHSSTARFPIPSVISIGLNLIELEGKLKVETVRRRRDHKMANHETHNQSIHQSSEQLQEAETFNIMPPATTMAANNIDPFRQFGQLSLDDANTTATPPKSENTNMPMTGAGYQYPNQQQYQQQQQPMQVSPEQPQQQPMMQPPTMQQPPMMQQQQQQHSVYGNYQYNPFEQQPAQTQMQQPPQFPQQQQQLQMSMPPQAQTQTQTNMMTNVTSPPISPLWAPASPEASPPGAAPAMPSQFGQAHPLPMAVGAPIPTLSPNPSSPAPVPVGSAASNPFDVFAAPTAPVQAPVPVPSLATDPFGSAAPVVQQPVPQQPAAQQQDDADFWNDMGFGVPSATDNSNTNNNNNMNNENNSIGNVTPNASVSDESYSSVTSTDSNTNDHASDYNIDHSMDETPVALDERGLPAGGTYYKARVTTPMLGAIFSSAKELRSTLFKTASNSFVEAIGDRPVISFTIDGSAADTAGIGLGHVLLKVNDIEVHATDEAVKTVGAAARPMIMEFYIPNKDVKVVKTEGQCMVKYDTHSTEAPASAIEWKPKYVVVGDMLGKAHILYMYRSKAEYDIAVKESQTRNRSLSVKVKQFDIRGAKIFHERGTVHYPNKPKWHYFTVVRGTGAPIKISAKSAEELLPVYEGIVTFLDKEAKMKKMKIEQSRERMHMQSMYRETYY